MGKRRQPSMNPAENDLVSGGPYLTPPDLTGQNTLGNQEILERIGAGGRPEGSLRFDDPNPKRGGRLPMPIADRLPLGGDTLRKKGNDWLDDPYGLKGPQPKPGPDIQGNSCSDLGERCLDTTDPLILSTPKIPI